MTGRLLYSDPLPCSEIQEDNRAQGNNRNDYASDIETTGLSCSYAVASETYLPVAIEELDDTDLSREAFM